MGVVGVVVWCGPLLKLAEDWGRAALGVGGCGAHWRAGPSVGPHALAVVLLVVVDACSNTN